MTTGKSQVKVRKMVEADLPKVNYIDGLLFGDRRTRVWAFSFEAYWSLYKPQLSFVAEINGEIVGFVGGIFAPEEHSRSIISLRRFERPSSRDQQVAWLDIVGIHPDYQHRGVGKALLEAFYAECKKHNASVRTGARETDEAVKDFLQGLGFRRSNFVTFVKD